MTPLNVAFNFEPGRRRLHPLLMTFLGEGEQGERPTFPTGQDKLRATEMFLLEAGHCSLAMDRLKDEDFTTRGHFGMMEVACYWNTGDCIQGCLNSCCLW